MVVVSVSSRGCEGVEVTMMHWGSLVRTWNTAPAFSRYCRMIASSGEISSTLVYNKLLCFKRG